MLSRHWPGLAKNAGPKPRLSSLVSSAARSARDRAARRRACAGRQVFLLALAARPACGTQKTTHSCERGGLPRGVSADDLTSTDLLDLALGVTGSSETVMVEVAGIEPASFSTSPGLLRAQPALLFSAPAVTQASRRRAQSLLNVPISPATGLSGGSS